MKTTNAGHAEMPLASTATTDAASAASATAATPNAALAATPTTSPRMAARLAYIETCMSLLEQVEAMFPEGDSLTAKDKRRKAKARKGSERWAPHLVAMARQYGVNLTLVPLDVIEDASEEATALVPMLKRIELLTARATSRTFALKSTAWSGSSKLYSVLKRLSGDSGDIEAGLAPVEHFFNHRHPSVAKKAKEALAAEKAPAP
jgi:hypothetical protein